MSQLEVHNAGITWRRPAALRRSGRLPRLAAGLRRRAGLYCSPCSWRPSVQSALPSPDRPRRRRGSRNGGYYSNLYGRDQFGHDLDKYLLEHGLDVRLDGH